MLPKVDRQLESVRVDLGVQTQRLERIAMTSVIDPSRRLEINHEPWTVRRLSTFYEKPTVDHPAGNGRLYLPPHQREWSWKNTGGLKKMRKFIDSVLHNYPIHTVILNAVDDGTRERWEIYDGRHRVETLWRYVHNDFAIVVDEGTPTQRVAFYRDLSDSDRARFNDRQIPVATTTAATSAQLADVFIRLNSGKPLTQADYCWACRDCPLIRDTMAVLAGNRERFRTVFGGVDIADRKNLPDWVGLFAGIVTGNAGDMTTSFERLKDVLGFTVPPERVGAFLDALFELYSRANTVAVVSTKELKKYAALGFVNAFFADRWLHETEIETVIDDWVRIIRHIRTTGNTWIVRVEGAQNLNNRKLSVVRDRISAWIAGTGTGTDEASTDTGSDEEEE